MFDIIKTFVGDEKGATAIEYGLIAALVSVAGLVALQGLGVSLQNMYTAVSRAVNAAVASGG